MRSIRANYTYNLIYQIFTIIIPLITTPYISRTLGATAIGDYSYTSGIVSYFAILAVTGTQSFGQREIASKFNNAHERSVLFYEIFYFRVICTLIVGAIYFIFISVFLKNYYLLFLIQFFTVFSWLIDISWYFQGTENFKLIVLRNGIVKICATILIFSMVKTPTDLWKYTLILTLSVFLGNCTLWMHIKGELQKVSMSEIHVFKNFKGIMKLFIPVVAVQVYTILDQTMIGTLANTTEVGYYSQAEKIIKMVITIMSSLIGVMIPRIAQLFVENEFEKINWYYEKAISFIFMIATPMLVGCIALCDKFVPLFFGEGYEPVINLMKMLSLLFVILSIGQLFGGFLVALHKENIYSKAVVSAAIVNFLLNYLLLKGVGLGALGAAVGTIIAELTSTSIQIIGAREHFRIKTILNNFIHYMFPSVAMAICVIISKMAFTGRVIGFVIPFVMGCSAYFSFLVLSKDEMALYAIRTVKGLFKK